MYNVFTNVKMSATCSKVKTSAENLQENLISSSGTVRDLEISQQVQYTTDTVIKIVVAPSVKDVQITEIQNITLLQNNHINEPRFKWRLYVKYSKLIIFTILWLLSGVLISRKVPVQEHHQIDVPINQVKGYTLSEIPSTGKLGLKIEGALLPPYYSNLSTHYLYVWVQFQVLLNPLDDPSTVKKNNVLLSQNISDVWKIPIVSENLIGVVPEVQQKHLFKLGNFTVEPFTSCVVRIKMKTNLNANLPLSLSYNIQPINMDHGIIYAAAVLAGLYILIIFDIIHRSIAAIFASTMSVAILTALNAGPTMEEIVSWIDVKTLLLLFSMMTIVSISSETGVFEYITVLAYKLTNGKEWPLITALCFITAVVSCFLDNVTTGLLMTPITIRLCEGVNFATFTLHMGIGSLLVSIVTFIQLRYMFNNLKDLRYEEPEEVLELKREIAVCQRTADCMSSYSKNEDSVKETLKKRSIRLLEKLNTKKRIACSAVDNYTSNLEDLQKKYPIKDKILLIKCICILIFVVVLFFLHSIPGMSESHPLHTGYLTKLKVKPKSAICWIPTYSNRQMADFSFTFLYTADIRFLGSLGLSGTAFLGAILLMLLYDRDDIESVVSRVEWLTLLFFGCLFILMEALAKLGLIEWIGKQTQDIIMSVQQESRLAVALLLILWVSALASTFVDNIPLTTMMIKVATVLADDVDLPLKPLVWALSLGACFGGNGTLFASSSNIVCASVAERHGYRFTFMQFMKIGFPVTITSLLIATVYLMVVHIVLGWE